MDLALIASAALLGLAGMPHCAAMCSAPCAAASGRGVAGAGSFHAARCGSYAGLGFLASASVGGLAALSQWSPALRPIWLLLHVAMLTLGLFLLTQGRQPDWMGRVGRAAAATGSAGSAVPVRLWRTPARAALAGSLWALWPCGLLQSALLVASMTQTPWAGAAAMAAFAVTSATGLAAAPVVMRLLKGPGASPSFERHLTRAAGALLAAGALFALGQHIWRPVAAFCGWD